MSNEIRFAEPGAGSADFDLNAPATLVCSRCMRGTLDIRCLMRTCSEASTAAPPVRARLVDEP